MLFILSHIQVMPSFLDLIFTFRARENPHERTKLSYETCLGKSQPRLTLPSLSISGFRAQHCFNLIGVEKTEMQQESWFIRQTAAYHSFDVAHHRSTWIVLKGNKLIRDRLQNSTALYRRERPDYPQTVQGCFLANLRSHILIFQWSAENWEPYIDYLEELLHRPSNISQHGRALKLDKDEGIEMTRKKNEIWKSLSSRQESALSDLVSSPSSNLRSGYVASSSRTGAQSIQRPETTLTSQMSTSLQLQDLALEEIFSFDQLQSLHRLGGRLQQAINILAQNKKLLEEMKEYFQDLINSRNFLSFVDLQAYVEDVAVFFRGIKKIIREMDGHQMRLKAMLYDLEKTTELVSLCLISTLFYTPEIS